MEMQTLREEIAKRPFEPFRLRLTDGSRIPVRHQEFIGVSPPRTVFVGKENGGHAILDVLHVVAIERSPASSRRGRQRN